MRKKHNTQPQRPRDLRGNEHLEIPELPEFTSSNMRGLHRRLSLLIGAIDVVRITCGDTELEQIMTDILRAGGVLIDDDK